MKNIYQFEDHERLRTGNWIDPINTSNYARDSYGGETKCSNRTVIGALAVTNTKITRTDPCRPHQVKGREECNFLLKVIKIERSKGVDQGKCRKVSSVQVSLYEDRLRSTDDD